MTPAGPGPALVTGASSEIGRALAQDLARDGRHVVLCGRSAPRLRATAEACERAGGSAEVLQADLADPDALESVVEQVQARSFAVVVHAAGTLVWADAAQADWRAAAAAVDVGLRAAVALTHATAGAMPAGGAMVYLASRAARTAFGHNASYVAAKHGLAGLAGSVFEDVRDRGVRVSLVCPGYVAAGATLGMGADPDELATFLTPQDVAEAVRFVLDYPARGCVTEIHLRPQRTSRFGG